MIVEGLLPDPRRPGSIRVFVDGRPAWTIPADAVAQLALVRGGTIRGETIERLDRAADEEGAFRAALRALERRAHGERELARKLQHKGHAPAAVQAAVHRLRAMELLDDATFARAYILARTARGRGPDRLRRDLAMLGVARDIANAVVADYIATTTDPLERARALVTRRASQMTALPVDARRRRLLAFLGRRGIVGSDARAMVEAVVHATGTVVAH